MGMPAARVGDMHVCPMVTGVVPHVGGPILPPCAPTVLTGKIPQARVGDMCTCVGPPDVIAMGAFTVLVQKMPAARMLDTTAHGGKIILGMFTVLIGDNGAGGGGGGGGAVAAMSPVCAQLADAHDMGMLANATYGADKPLPPNYTRVSDPGELSQLGLTPEQLSPPANEKSNFHAEVFRRGNPEGYVVAFRGTQPTQLADWKANLKQGSGLPSDHYDRALAISNSVALSGKDVSYTGHSLGGGLASAAAANTGHRATTFNAAGLSAATVGGYPDPPAPVTAYNTPRDPLSALQDNRGSVLTGATAAAAAIHPVLGAAVGGYLAGREMGDSPVLPQAYGTRHELPETESWIDRHNPLNLIEPHSMDSVMKGLEAEQANQGCK